LNEFTKLIVVMYVI